MKRILLLSIIVFCCLQNLHAEDAENGWFRWDDPGLLGFIDSISVSGYSQALDDAGTIGACSALLLPGLLTAVPTVKRKEALSWGIIYCEAFLLTAGTKTFLKRIVERPRPYWSETGVPEGLEEECFDSFPSGHTAYAFLGASFLSAVLSMESPDWKGRLPLTLGGYLLASGVGAFRIAAGTHYPSDVIIGAGIGLLYGHLLPRLQMINGRDVRLSLQPASGGMGLSLSCSFGGDELTYDR